MTEKNIFITPAETEEQRQIMNSIKASFSGQSPLAMVETFGCQQNVNDSQRIEGMLLQMGFTLTDDREKADIIYEVGEVTERITKVQRINKDKSELQLLLDTMESLKE